jgi:hypothetical protein
MISTISSPAKGAAARALLMLSVTFALLSGPIILLAHGGGTPQVLNEPAGPYLISVWTDPEPLRTDESHVNVAVLEPDTRAPVLEGVEVLVQLRPPGDESSLLTKEATTEQSTNKTIFVAVFEDLPSDGRWDVSVTARGPAGDSDPVAFEVDILPPAPRDWLRIGLSAAGVIALIAAVAVWLRRQPREVSSRRRRPAR